MSNKLFIDTIACYVQKYASAYNIAVCSPIIAQAILESASGTSELAVNAHNYFGLKYRAGRCKTSNGIYTKIGSEQNSNGTYESSVMQWCRFPNMENGVIGYFDFINISNYSNLKGVQDPKRYLENIKSDGYATSLKYVDNLMSVIRKYDLTKYDKNKEENRMSNSPLVSYTKLSPNKNSPRNHQIDRITPHCVVGQLSAESICACFPAGRDASCNYGIGTDGHISLCVDEKDRSWCSSNSVNDHRAVTIECASDKTEPYAMNSNVCESLIKLCVDICKRNGKSKLLWFGDKTKTLNYSAKSDEMIITVHRWFANKSCPGNWLYARLGNLASEVTNRLSSGGNNQGEGNTPTDTETLYRVQTGAFSKKSNADALVAKLKTTGFDTYMVMSGGLYKVQVGAYSKKENAENQMTKLKAKGFDAFITTQSGSAVFGDTTKKSSSEIAREIYNGTCSDPRWSTWGNGADRVNRLTQAGYDPNSVQAEVNKLF